MRMIAGFATILLSVTYCIAYSTSPSSRTQYPNMLIGDHYGILNEKDLDLDGKHVPFTGGGDSLYQSYWQCFLREQVSMTLIDSGYPSEEIENVDTLADLSIKVVAQPGVFHEYSMRRRVPTDEFEKRFRLWRELLRGELYVCLEGSAGTIEDRSVPGSHRKIVYSWIFEKIKTKKGCDSYFDPCSQ